MKALSWLLDMLFVSDIVLNFRTGFISNGYVIMDPKRIARKYLKFWFWVDVAASMPLELAIMTGGVDSTDSGSGADTKAARKSLKMLKYLKLAKLLRLGRIVKYLRKYSKYYGMFLLSFSYFFMLHFMTCM